MFLRDDDEAVGVTDDDVARIDRNATGQWAR
jgi:hypothetical protein